MFEVFLNHPRGVIPPNPWPLVAFGTGLMILAGLGVLTYERLQENKALDAIIARTTLKIDSLERLLSTLKDAETGQRGYLLTGRSSYLTPYWEARTRLPGDVDHAARFVNAETLQAALVEQLRSLIDQKLEELRETIDLTKVGRLDQAKRLVLTDQGKATMDAIRSLIGELTEADRARLREESERKSMLTRRVDFLVLLGLVLSGVFIISAGLLYHQELANRRRAEQELRYANEELRVKEERYRLAARATNDGIWDMDLRAGQVVCNEVFEEWFGLLPNDLETAQQVWSERLHPDDRERVTLGLHDALMTSVGHWRAEYRCRRIDGTYAEVLDRAFIARDSSGHATRIVGAVLDLTERKRAEEEIKALLQAAESREHELRETQAQLVQSAKLASLGELAAGIAQELNNPLNNISLFVGNAVDALTHEHAEPHAVLKPLRAVQKQVQRAATIIAHMRRFGRAAPSAQQVLSLDDAIRSAYAFVHEQLRLAAVQVELNFAAPPPMVEGNAMQLEQVFVNLFMNAADAMADSRKKHLIVKTTRGRSHVTVRVQDTGCGIDPAVLTRIFDPFFTTKPVGKGTGLGLSVSHGIIKDHRGTIRVGSEVGVGTWFDIELPLALEPRGTGQ